MSRNRSKIFDEIFLFFLFPHLPFSSHPRELTRVNFRLYILFFSLSVPKLFRSLLFNNEPLLVSLKSFTLF